MDKRGQKRIFSLNNFLPENHRGQGMSISTIILLILGVVILVVLVLGFSVGWNKILPFISSNNVNTITQQCGAACTTADTYSFCLRTFDLKTDTATTKNVTCNYLAKQQPQYGITPCSELPCSDIVFITATDIADFQTEAKCTGNAGKTIQALIGDTLRGRNCQAAAV
jgi:hypothetical protein